MKLEVKLKKCGSKKIFWSEAEARSEAGKTGAWKKFQSEVEVKLEKTRSEKKFQSEVKQGFSGRNFKVKQASLLHPLPPLTAYFYIHQVVNLHDVLTFYKHTK